MILERLYARGIRNLKPLDLRPAIGLNVITGANGSGKTAFLEAVHLAVRGQSFRSREIGEVIANGDDGLEVAGWFRPVPSATGSEEGGRRSTIRRQRSRNRPTCSLDGEPARNLRGLSTDVACVVIGQDDARATRVSAERRRTLIDGFLFHVEPDFADAWRRVRSILRQRNAGLRAGKDTRVWDHMLAEQGHVLDERRDQHIREITIRLPESARACGLEEGISVLYRRGWAGGTLADVLAASLERDRTAGYTTAGPHRADLTIRVGNVRLIEQASAGQAKLALLAFRHAQLSLLTDVDILLLVDDLAAELDDERIERCIAALASRSTQMFATSPKTGAFGANARPKKTFHVEHGELTSPKTPD